MPLHRLSLLFSYNEFNPIAHIIGLFWTLVNLWGTFLSSTPHRSGPPRTLLLPCLRHSVVPLGVACGEPCAEARSVLADGRQPSCFAYRLASGGGCPERRGRRAFVTRPGAQKRAVPQGDSPSANKLCSVSYSLIL